VSERIGYTMGVKIAKPSPKAAKRSLELIRAAVLPIFYLLLVLAEHYGLIDRWRGLDRVKAVAFQPLLCSRCEHACACGGCSVGAAHRSHPEVL
jgi:hypothetical protein